MSSHGRARRAVQSLWVAVPAFTLGWLSGAAFLYAGLRARMRSWTLMGLVYGVTGILGFTLIEGDGAIDTSAEHLGLSLSVGTMAVATAHALAIRRRYLDRINGTPTSRLAAAERVLEEREQALAIVDDDPLRARELGIGRPGERGGYHGHLVDLNHASQAAIAALPRVGAEVAARAVAVRDEVQGFDSLEDAGELLDLPPATVERLRGLAVCLPY